jgi:hypothetical protein
MQIQLLVPLRQQPQSAYWLQVVREQHRLQYFLQLAQFQLPVMQVDLAQQ